MKHAVFSSWLVGTLSRLHAARLLLALCLAAAAGTCHAQDFSAFVLYPTGTGSKPLGVALGDVTGDGIPDLLAANVNTATLGVLPGVGDGTFNPAVSYAAGAGAPQSVQVRDLNGDGRLDVVLGNASNVGVLLGQAAGGLAAAVAYPAPMTSQPGSLALADVNNDGKVDAVTVDNTTSRAYVLLGQVAGTFALASSYPVGAATNPEAVAVGDVTGDGNADIVAANGNNTVAVLPGNGSGAFGAATLLSLGTAGGLTGVALADITADGRLDIVVVNNSASTVGVFVGQAGGAFASAVSYPVGASSPVGIALGDTNDDGRLDVVTANFGAHSASVLLGSGTGTFGQPAVYAAGPGSSPIGVVLGDVDGNNRPDIVLGNFNSPAAAVLLNTLPGLYLSGPGSGAAGTALTLRGNSLAGATAVTFASAAGGSATVPASSFTSTNYTASPNTIALRVPASLAAGLYTLRVATPRGLTPAFSFRVTGALAQHAATLTAATVSLAPNPAQATATVSVPAVAGEHQATVQLCSALGSLVRAQQVELPATGLQYPLDLGGLAAGLYIVRIQVGTSCVNQRLLINY